MDADVLKVPGSWKAVLQAELEQPYFQALSQFLAEERRTQQVFPPPEQVFTALELTPFEQARVLILGQDPYHDDGQAHGLAFSVPPGVRPPPSLVNIFKELQADVGCPKPSSGSLIPWARQGVVLLNAVLTVRAHQPNSHKDRGWERFTDAVLRALAERAQPMVFVLWGGYAQKKAKLVDTGRHTLHLSAHPSPLSARNGFFGSKPFSAVNQALEAMGQKPIDWCLPG